MENELLPCPFCGKSDMLREMDECGDTLVDCQRCEASAWKDIWRRRYRPRYKWVDLDEMKKQDDGMNDSAEYVYNRAIDDIKSKYGDLYVGVKK